MTVLLMIRVPPAGSVASPVDITSISCFYTPSVSLLGGYSRTISKAGDRTASIGEPGSYAPSISRTGSP